MIEIVDVGLFTHMQKKFVLSKIKKKTCTKKFFLPLFFTKMLLSAKGMRKNSILTSGENKELFCHKISTDLCKHFNYSDT